MWNEKSYYSQGEKKLENSVELTQNLQVTASENTNNSEIEAKSIEEENKISEEVTAETSEKEVKE